jgi:hypothetical protein
MLEIARKLFQRVPLSEYAKFTSFGTSSHSETTSSEIVSKEVEQYRDFNRELYRQHTS